MAEPLREVELDERSLTFLLAGMVGLLSIAFFMGVRVGRDSAGESVMAPRARRAPLRPAAAAAAKPEPRPAAGASVTAGGRPSWKNGLLGPPPLPAPAPLGGSPGVSQRGETRAFALEVLAVDDQERALAERIRLLGRGYPAYVVPVAAGRPADRYRVRLGDYASLADAERVAADLKSREGLSSDIVK